jgi:TolA-binding protein
MRIYGSKPVRCSRTSPPHGRRGLLWLALFLGLPAHALHAQAANQENLSQQIQQLTESMAKTQAQLEQSQRELDEMRRQLAAMQLQMAGSTATAAPASTATTSSSATQNTITAIDDLHEHQAMQDAQIATHEQTKVESESKYPVKITGMLLLNGFVNTSQVDMPATPTVAVAGAGSTGASVRQTVLGFDARGPHLFGATSYADLRIDFAGGAQYDTAIGNYSGYYNAAATFLRLRTAHAGLKWDRTEAYFSLDRPIFTPNTPTSLTAVAEPALAWSGNLWTWNPQLGVTHDLGLNSSRDLRLQAALIDVGDAPLSPASISAASAGTANGSEASRWPGAEARVALLGSKLHDEGDHIGVGGYFAPHLNALGYRFDSWAGTLDARLLLPARLEFTGSFYRGQALGGLGGGGYKDFVYRSATDSSGYRFRPLPDVGGWAQLKEKLNERLEFNAAFGMDDVFPHTLRRYTVPGATYQNLARNRTYTGNVIFSPSAYLLFSIEYRHLQSIPVTGLPATTDVIGAAAGYRF